MALTALASAVVGPGATPAGADQGLRWSGRSTYTVDPTAGLVRVALDLTLTNETSVYFFTDISFRVLAETTNVRVTRVGGGSLTSTLTPYNDNLGTLRIALSPDVLPGQTQRLQVTYDLVGQAPRTQRWTRVNPAFVALLATAVGDPGLASVEVRLPAGFQVDWSNGELVREDVGGQIVLRADAIADPNSWYVLVSGDDETRLVGRSIRVGDQAITVRAWPGDEEWATFVARAAKQGIPALQRLVGLDFLEDDDFEIIETNNPNLRGYAGVYLPQGRIEIDDSLDPELVFHELSHSWFNTDTFDGRWINEGMAQEYASRALRATGNGRTKPGPLDPTNPLAVPLAEWQQPFVFDDQAEAREAWGYNASWHVAHEIVDRAGVPAMRTVIQAAANSEIAYLGDGDPEKFGNTVGWRELIDLLDERTTARGLDRIFEQTVVPAGDRDAFADRVQARRRYKTLERESGRWAPPLGLRRAMAGWRFVKADRLIVGARKALALRTQLRALAEVGGFTVSKGLEERYETSFEPGGVTDTLRDHVAAGKEVVAADAAVDADRGVFTTIGLIGADPGRDLDRARQAMGAGNTGTAEAAARAARETLDDAAGVGRRRTVTVLGGLLVLALAVLGGRRVRRRRKAEAADDHTDPSASQLGMHPPDL